VLIIVVEVRVK